MITREEKSAQVKEFGEKFGKAEAVFLAEYQGIEANDMTTLRKSLRDAGVEFKVMRNTLAGRAVKGTRYEAMADSFTGPVGIAISYKDAAAAAKALTAFAKEKDKFKLRAGSLGGKALSVADIKSLSELPSKPELVGKLLGVMNNVPRGLVCVLSGVPRKFLYALNAIKDAKSGSAKA